MSLGSVFHTNHFIYETAIDAFEDFDKKAGRKLSPSQFRVVMSVGDEGMARFTSNRSEKSIMTTSNGTRILFRACVPQLSVLKQADLFITHSGMNSTSETIKYGVPIVAIPLEADQPMNARRACDELSLGVRLDLFQLNPDELADAIEHVLSDEKYKRNISAMANVTAGCNGSVEGARIIGEYLS